MTTPTRASFELATRPGLVQAVTHLEMALAAGVLDLGHLHRYTELRRGVKGIRRARRAVALARVGAESPQETRLRLALVLAGLPEPAMQYEIRDSAGCFLARVDLCYPEAKLVLEYDGAYHATTLPADVRRQNALVMNGWQVLRFARGDLVDPLHAPNVVRKALSDRGFRIGRQIAR